jgi:hypothetical protein
VCGQFVELARPGQAAQALQAAVGELVEVALDAAARDIGGACLAPTLAFFLTPATIVGS